MKKQISIAAIAIVALAMLCQSADARSRRHQHRSGVDPRVEATGMVVGIGAGVANLALRDWHFSSSGTYNGLSAGGAWVGTSIGCAAIAPMVATVVINRPLTMREGHVLIAGCFIPFLGPMWVNAAYDAHPEWEGKRRRRR